MLGQAEPENRIPQVDMASLARGAPADEFSVTPSSRLLEDEWDRLLESSDATRADMAVALRRLRREMGEREQAEASVRQFEDIVRNMRVGILVYALEDIEDDHSLRLIRTNEASAQMLGIPLNELLGRKIDSCFPNLREAGLPQRYARLAAQGGFLDLGDVQYTDSRVSGWYSVRAFSLPENCVGVTFEDITERKQMEQELVESRERLRELGHHMEAARENERRLVAEQVHEELGQVLAALRMQLARPCRPGEDGAGRHASLLELVDMCIATMKRVTRELHPPEIEHLGLGAAIRAECDRIALERDVDISARCELHDEDLDPSLAISLFRMVSAIVRSSLSSLETKRIQIELTAAHDHIRVCVEVASSALDMLTAKDSLLIVELNERLLAWDGALSVSTPAQNLARLCISVPAPTPSQR